MTPSDKEIPSGVKENIQKMAALIWFEKWQNFLGQLTVSMEMFILLVDWAQTRLKWDELHIVE
jgi:hypothetical protein